MRTVPSPPPSGSRAPDGTTRRSVVVIDDERTFADLLHHALSDQPDLDCVGVAYDLDSGLALVDQHAPDVVLLDVHFRGAERDGVDAAGEILALRRDTWVVLLTGRADADILRRAADVGVCSLLPKDGSLPELLTTVRTARLGELVVHPALLRTLAAAERPAKRSKRSLSQREEEVLALMMTGLDSRSIADQLGISIHTCRSYVKAVLRKLDAHSALEAVAIARQRGLVEPGRIG